MRNITGGIGMEYLVFSLGFIVIHIISYMIAGVLSLRINKDIYEGKSRSMDYHRDMTDATESKHVHKWLFPGQIMRGLVFSIILYPVLSQLGEVTFIARYAFFAGLMFVYTHLACAAPCPDNIEGFLYMKEGYIKKSSFIRFQFEMIIYSLILGFLVSYFLF